MSNFLAFPIEQIPYVVIALVIAFTLHEFAHAYVAYKFGDMTAKNQGRLTLSPLSHLDPIGTLLIFIAGFGWAKPVPVNRYFFKNPRLAGVLVSIAGPLSNLVIAFVGLFILNAMVHFGIIGLLPIGFGDSLYSFFIILINLNVLLFVFNLLPFPPLDGYRVIEDLSPPDIRAKLTQYENYGALIFLILVITPLDRYTIQPIFNTFIPFVNNILAIIMNIIF
ncbi:site-2 protease family protein [Cytobacillus sp. IB215665]|uniref:site-2 protease family protein n=1 Tax=Cytobacillus sp. IB215665 TaxID=3097357 RepID=UPI002A13F8B1|nr:site-2 protease family protein [Cytobacillus sp. IB215665]MDX8363650.1 site-2 protease family protein [Cytobacillus sp. IB215665]